MQLLQRQAGDGGVDGLVDPPEGVGEEIATFHGITVPKFGEPAPADPAPHVPHGWEARVLFEENTRTLFCGDLFTHLGNGPAVTEDDLVDAAVEAESIFRYTSCLTATVAALRSLAALQPTTLAVMHGSCFRGDGARALSELADALYTRFSPEAGFIVVPNVEGPHGVAGS